MFIFANNQLRSREQFVYTLTSLVEIFCRSRTAISFSHAQLVTFAFTEQGLTIILIQLVL